MAYAGGYAGGYADTIVPPAPTDQGTGYKVQHPIYRQPTRTTGRATIRLRVTILTWGAEAQNAAVLTLAAATLGSGAGNGRADTAISTDISIRNSHAAGVTRAELGSYIADPLTDDRRVALMLAALLEHQE